MRKLYPLAQVVSKAVQSLKAREISEPESSVKYLVDHVLNTDRSKRTTYFPKNLDEEQLKHFYRLLEKRYLSIPVQYILGEWNFRGLTLKMKPPVFIPRPETENLVDIVLRRIQVIKETLDRPLKVLEVGCGSGAISLAIAKEDESVHCTAVDKSLQAVSLTKENAERLGLQTKISVHHSCLDDRETLTNMDSQHSEYDLIVSNPPYLMEAEMRNLMPEVQRYEDHDALYGGINGMNVILQILKFSRKALGSEGTVFLEVGLSHPLLIKKCLHQPDYASLELVKVYEDFTGRERFVEIRLKCC